MNHSAELRWFVPGELPGKVLGWFSAVALPQEHRVDEYLALPGATCVGVKLRGRSILEMKARTSDPELWSHGNDVTGRRDSWVKWSCPVPDIGEMRAAILAREDTVVAVRKSRMIRQFAYVAGASNEVSGAARPAEGCNVELTEISIEDLSSERLYWTLGLESFSSRDRVSQVLTATASTFFSASPCPVRLTADASLSYPEWIDRELRP